MCEITATELKTHLGKYMELGKREEIVVTHRGKPIFTIVPRKEEIAKKWEALFGVLPPEAAKDNDIDRE